MNIGILGGGQLGRMLALAGYPLGCHFRVFDPSPSACAAQVAEAVVGEFDDYAALGRFLKGLDTVTFEFENVPVETARWLADRVPVFPPPDALAVAQERFSEKEFFTQLGIPTPRYRVIDDREQIDTALMEWQSAGVLKTRRFGYDGKGQAVVRSIADVPAIWEQLGGRPLILEEFVAFERELSLIAVRGADGDTAFYPLIENHHRDGMLRFSLAPARCLSAELQWQAESYARRVLERLGYVGVLTIEWFERAGQLLANEMAPRVHNSGHWTIESAFTSQFENHLRAGLGWPLGATQVLGSSILVNLIGALPESATVLSHWGAALHLYGKEARPNRKVGHVTVRSMDDKDRQGRLQAGFPWPGSDAVPPHWQSG